MVSFDELSGNRSCSPHPLPLLPSQGTAIAEELGGTGTTEMHEQGRYL